MGTMDLRTEIQQRLQAFEKGSLRDNALALLGTLGYTSEKRITLAPNNLEQFLSTFAQGKILSEKLALPEEWKTIDFLFQLTDDEILAAGNQKSLFDSKGAYNGTVIESYLFFALDLKGSHYTRTALAGITRELNKLFAMPALILFRHGDALTLAIINRRLHKRDQTRDVLEKVTLIKDITFADPIRAHLEILNDFAFANLDTEFGVANFVALHNAWQKKLGSYALSNDFYREIADWYFWAHHQVEDGTIRLPQHCDTEEEKSLFLIRLLTRLIFCWFLVEKRLLPADLFRDHSLKKLIKDLSLSAPTYYHAVLQNLFFGTLNMPPEQRSFREKKKDGERYDQNYGITNLWRYETDFRDSAEWISLATRVPFLNGGLFDCLDDKTGQKKDNFILDGFSDNPKLACHLPNDLFFGPERVVDLSKDYGEDDKRTARSKRAKVRGLIEILSRYKFTIEENTPLEEEIALDPELLGKVFENLLASYNEDTRTTARKALGAFYTPREIVTYMVDEALKSYLSTQVPRVKGVLDDLFSNKATLKDIKPDQRDALIAAIGRVKILDPACGSGAFPMGALHRLVDLLQKLDPNNESWKRDRLAEARRYRELLEEAGAPKEEIAACDARITDIEKSFDSRFHALDFARKLYLIENSIYGVDIQPVAVQIAKLRFFIALVVDQKVNPKEKNLGVRPLPNLETRLVAADTLIPLPKPKERYGNLFNDDTEALRQHNRLKDELKRIRHEHFNARDPQRKHHWREEDQRVREELSVVLRKTGMKADAARAMATWDPYDQNTFAPFFDSEWMFGLPVGKVRVEGRSPATLLGNFALINETRGQTELATTAPIEIDSGFDVVIGNPPYVRQEKIIHIKSLLQPNYPDTYTGTADLYVYFYDRALQLLRCNGILSFITSNKWYRVAYGHKLRAHLAKTATLIHAIDFGDAPVFTAIAYPTIIIASKGAPQPSHVFRALNWDAHTPSNEIGNFAKFYETKAKSCFQSTLSGESWKFADTSREELLNKMRRVGQSLRDFVNSRVYRGITTGLNEAFVLNGTEREALITQDKSADESIKRHIRGRDVERWLLASRDEWLIFTRGNFKIRKRSAIYKHLEKFRSRLTPGVDGGRKPGSYEWFEIQDNIAYWQQFEKPKIVSTKVSIRPTFALDRSGSYLANTAYFFPVDDAALYLLALLNSNVSFAYAKRAFVEKQGGWYEVQPQGLEAFPVPNATPMERKCVECATAWVEWLSQHFAAYPAALTTRDPLMLAYIEQILNGLVYELYFPEEVHGAGLRMFELVEQAALPALEAIPETKRLATLRPLFEALYDGTHPLKIALQKLQTLETVRIIEGKA